MDVSIVAAIGSFVVSERVIKAKATVLVILVGVVLYDLTILSQDPAALRVYRGPALIAVTLVCCAFSLRSWRRNGVACDELLFLPGTPHAENYGIVGPCHSPLTLQMATTLGRRNRCDSGVETDEFLHPNVQTGADAAAGLSPNENAVLRTESAAAKAPSVSSVASCSSRGSRDFSPDRNKLSDRPRLKSIHHIDGHDAKQEDTLPDNWRDDGADHDVDSIPTQTADDADENVWRTLMFTLTRRTDASSNDRSSGSSASLTPPESASPEEFEGGAQSHESSRQSRGFRRYFSSLNASDTTEYAPSGPTVASAALDLMLPTMFNFHLFMMASHSPSVVTPAQILPLAFLTILMLRSVFPPSRRLRFYNTIKYTVCAPFCYVNFRDAFVGDILTSLVRPFQDLCFALFYYFASIYGAASGKRALEDSGSTVEHSWVLINVVLPVCAILPFWWKFMQTLRQAYDSQRRWPHLGNAFKYLSAHTIILYGMTHQEGRRSFWWILSFVSATLFQIWWDTFIDWELLVIKPTNSDQLQKQSLKEEQMPSLDHFDDDEVHTLSTYEMLVRGKLTPFMLIRQAEECILKFRQIQLRPKRLYKTDYYYWRIFFVNAIFRFAWMLSCIPAHHFESDSGKIVTTFSFDVKGFVGFAISLGEIVRRCWWGILKVELETIKLTCPDYCLDADRSSLKAQYSCLPTDAPSRSENMSTKRAYLSFLDEQFIRKAFIVELSVWAVAFVGLGVWAVALR